MRSPISPPAPETGSDAQLFPDGLLLRFAADPPLVRVGEGTPPELVDEAVRVVQLLNMALPRDWQIGFGNEPGAAGTAAPASSEIIITFAALEDWPDEVIPPGGPPEGGGIGLAVPLLEIYATGDPERPWNLQITGGRIWIDPTRTEGDERLGVIAHELIHVLGRAHPDPTRFPDSIMVAGGGDGPDVAHPPPPSTGRPSSRSTAASSPVARRTRSRSTSGPWADTSTHLYGLLGLAGGEIAFGAAFSNGLVQPWATGPGPGSELGENPHLAGTAHWSGRLLGFTPARPRRSPGPRSLQSALIRSTAISLSLPWSTGRPAAHRAPSARAPCGRTAISATASRCEATPLFRPGAIPAP